MVPRGAFLVVDGGCIPFRSTPVCARACRCLVLRVPIGAATRAAAAAEKRAREEKEKEAAAQRLRKYITGGTGLTAATPEPVAVAETAELEEPRRRRRRSSAVATV